MTPHMRSALDWLRERGGDGVFQRIKLKPEDLGPCNCMLAAGETGPFQWTTWLKLVKAGVLQEYRLGKARRFRVVEAPAP